MQQNITEIEAFVYIWYDGNNKMFYIGVHKGDPNLSPYAHSSTAMESFTMQTIPPGFKRRILATGSHEDMLVLEAEFLMDRRVVINPRYHNQSIMTPRLLGSTRTSPYHRAKVKELKEMQSRRIKLKRDKQKEQASIGEERKVRRQILKVSWDDTYPGGFSPDVINEVQATFADISWPTIVPIRKVKKVKQSRASIHQKEDARARGVQKTREYYGLDEL